MTSEASAQDAALSDGGKSEPQFVIAHDGRYYLTRAVWEYDPRHASLTETQQVGVEQMGDLFARLAKEGWGRSAVLLPVAHIGHCHSLQHT